MEKLSNNINNKFYRPDYREKYDLDPKKIINVIEYSYDDLGFYLKNKPYISSNITKLEDKDFSLIYPFMVNL